MPSPGSNYDLLMLWLDLGLYDQIEWFSNITHNWIPVTKADENWWRIHYICNWPVRLKNGNQES